MAQSEFEKRFPSRDSAATSTLASNVKNLREQKGWTQDELAAKVNVKQAAISHIETGRANPTLLILENLARALGVDLPELLSPQKKKRPSKRQ